MNDPRRDPHVRVSREAAQLLSQERAAQAHVEQVEREAREHAEAYGARVTSIMDELLITFPNPPQAFHVETYVLTRPGHRYPTAHCQARNYTEALLYFQEHHGPIRMDEVRRTR